MLQNIEEALRRTPQDVLDARIQRHKRAMDLSLKHTALPKEMQDQQTPFQYYLQVLSPISTIRSRHTQPGLLLYLCLCSACPHFLSTQTIHMSSTVLLTFFLSSLLRVLIWLLVPERIHLLNESTDLDSTLHHSAAREQDVSQQRRQIMFQLVTRVASPGGGTSSCVMQPSSALFPSVWGGHYPPLSFPKYTALITLPITHSSFSNVH